MMTNLLYASADESAGFIEEPADDFMRPNDFSRTGGMATLRRSLQPTVP